MSSPRPLAAGANGLPSPWEPKSKEIFFELAFTNEFKGEASEHETSALALLKNNDDSNNMSHELDKCVVESIEFIGVSAPQNINADSLSLSIGVKNHNGNNLVTTQILTDNKWFPFYIRKKHSIIYKRPAEKARDALLTAYGNLNEDLIEQWRKNKTFPREMSHLLQQFLPEASVERGAIHKHLSQDMADEVARLLLLRKEELDAKFDNFSTIYGTVRVINDPAASEKMFSSKGLEGSISKDTPLFVCLKLNVRCYDNA